MAYEVITLNLIPSGDVPVIHAAQYDKNRQLNFALKLGDDDFNPSGYDLELQIRKVDNNIVTVAPSLVNNNVVTFLSTEQMTACSGTNLGEIQITKDDLDIATLHFYLVVQRDVLAGGMTSTSDIHNLEEQIEELLPEALGNQYYTKDQTNTLLDGKADVSDIPDMSDYYTKSETYSSNEVNTLLSGKADTSSLAAVATSGSYNDLSNKPTIPAAQVNADWDAISGVAMILNKPTIPDAQVQSDWAQSDNTKVDYIKNKPTIPTIETATIQNVAIATFPDGADNVPVKSLKVDIEPNLSGVSSVNVYRMGKNLIGKNGGWNSSGVYEPTASAICSEKLKVNQGLQFIAQKSQAFTSTWSELRVIVFDTNGDYVSQSVVLGYSALVSSVYTVGANVGFIAFSVYLNGNDKSNIDSFNVMVEVGNTATTYEPYNGTTYPISLGGTYYGGTLDVTNGSLTVKYGRVDLGSLDWNYNSTNQRMDCISTINNLKAPSSNFVAFNGVCAIYTIVSNQALADKCVAINISGSLRIKDLDYTDATAFKTAMSGKYLTYELATPTTVTLTPTQVKTLLGNNNIFADSGNVNEVVYFKTGCESIARLIEAYL